ncbi:hypothetical protein TRFO_27219 [Tritrichomonas foetus]|uniref:Uncharacterized protein n=1 Tax=Tritrichomonas foetus TaxID=1144522 RepID=A0A1J4K193_9EUKA|nr:hypothetical protein TRFO_27219 [Tritrichomonas foetus]|eukprot:OHT05151.1 hypothetical protein TRFO_27219 [Tritrichomonas foetus]
MKKLRFIKLIIKKNDRISCSQWHFFFYIYLLYSILQKLLHFLSARTQKAIFIRCDFMIRRLTKTCQCGFIQTTNNDFTSLTISVDSSETIEEALKNYFQPDILLNYSCEHCLQQTSVRTIDMIARMPYFLVLREELDLEFQR